MNTTNDSTSRQTIVNEVDRHIPFLRKRWDEFCQSVEDCVPLLKRWASDPIQDEIRKAEERRDQQTMSAQQEQRELITEHNRLKRRSAKRRRLDKLTESSSQLRRALDATPNMPPPGWVRRNASAYPYYDLEYIDDDELKRDCRIFFTPPDVAIPSLWCFQAQWHGQRKPERDEPLLVECVILSVVHDRHVGEDEPRIYDRGTYPAGRQFRCDAFCDDLWYGKPSILPSLYGLADPKSDDFILRAWNRVKDRLPQADLGNSDQKPNGPALTSVNAGAHMNFSFNNSQVTMGDINQTQSLATGNHSSIGKETPTSQENNKGIKRTTVIVSGVVIFLAALLECLYYLGWLDPIKEVIRGLLVGR